MTEFFEPVLPKKRKGRITKEMRRKVNGRSFIEIEKELNGLSYDPTVVRKPRTTIENNRKKYNRYYFAKHK